MGYMVVPEHLVDTFRTGLSELYREGQLMQQAVLAEFIMDGHLTSHVRRMRTLYGERRQLMIDAIRARFGDALPVMGDEAGLHLVLGLPDACDDRAVTQSAFDAGVIVRPLTSYYSSLDTARRGLLLVCVRPARRHRPRVRHAREYHRATPAAGPHARGIAAPMRRAARASPYRALPAPRSSDAARTASPGFVNTRCRSAAICASRSCGVRPADSICARCTT